MTNSSSTSFIFFGVGFNDDSAERIFEKVVPPEERGLETDYENIGETLYEWAEKLTGPVRVYIDWECNYGAVYIKDSHQYVEGSFVDIPLDQISAFSGKTKEWEKQLRDFCKEYGIVPAKAWKRIDKASWKIALEVPR